MLKQIIYTSQALNTEPAETSKSYDFDSAQKSETMKISDTEKLKYTNNISK